MLDRFYKRLRRNLTGEMYERLRNKLGRAKAWESLQAPLLILKHYQDSGVDFKGKRVLELGCGNRFHTAFGMLLGGAAEVHLCDPKLDASKLKSDLEIWCQTQPRPDQAERRIFAWADLSELKKSFKNSFDLFLSHQVMEHVANPTEVLSNAQTLLNEKGSIYSRIDISDHTYHIFTRFPFGNALFQANSLRHLGYSDAQWAELQDPKCPMNRWLPERFANAAVTLGMRVTWSEQIVANGQSIHPDVGGIWQKSPNPLSSVGLWMHKAV